MFEGVLFILKICKRLFFLISVFMCLLFSSFTSFAITPFNGLNLQLFDDGPWAGQSAVFVQPLLDGTYSYYGVPSWRDGNSAGQGYYKNIGSFSTPVDGYFFSGDQIDNVVIWSYGPLKELYVVDSSGVVVADVLEDAFLVAPTGSRYFYGVSLSGGAGVAFSCDSQVTLTEFSPAFNGGSYYDQILDAMPYLGGIYDSNSVAIRYPGIGVDAIVPYRLTYGFNYFYFPVIGFDNGDENDLLGFYLCGDTGVINSGSTYEIIFRAYNLRPAENWFPLISSSYGSASYDGTYMSICFDGLSDRNFLLSQLFYRCQRNLDMPDAACLIYVSSSSDDIGTLPPDDSGSGEGGSSPNYTNALSQIGNLLEDVMGAVSGGAHQVVNNITYQTTQITNTITNTVTNMTQQITQGLQSVQQGITDKLGAVQDGITNKLQNVQDGINNKLESVQEEIVNGYDNSAMESEKSELSGSVEELEQAEKEVMDNVTGYLEDFEYPTFDSISGGVLASIAFIGTFLQSLFLAIGDFGLIITFSLTMIFVLIIVGYHRIRT